MQQVFAPLYVIAFTFVVSWMFVRGTIWLAPKVGLLDHPRGGRLHTRPMPLMGGVGMFLAMAAVIGVHAVFLQYGRALLPTELASYLPSPSIGAWQRLLILGAGGLCILLIGVVDDIKQTGVGFRILLECAVAGLIVFFGVCPTLAHMSDWVVMPLTVIWIVGVINAFNLVDGLDGLAGLLACVTSAVLLVFMLMTGQEVVALLLAVVVGVTLGFLYWNWHPAKTYMGSGGSLLLGYLLATIPLVSEFMQHHSNSLAPMLLPVLVLSVPLYDTASVIFLRLNHGRSPFKSDHNHLAHRLQRLGLSVPQTVAAMALLGLATGLMSLLLADAMAGEALLILFSVGAMFSVFIILERVHLAHYDAERLVDIAGHCWVNGDAQSRDAATGYEIHVRLASRERIELEAALPSLPIFAEAMGEGRPVTLELCSPLTPTPLTMLCSIRSVWRSDTNKTYVGLSPMFADASSSDAARAWISKAIYPTRSA